MTEAGIALLVVLTAVNLFLLWRLVARSQRDSFGERQAEQMADLERRVREDLRASRDDAGKGARSLREEVAGGLKNTGDSLVNAQTKTLGELGRMQKDQLEGVTRQLRELAEKNEARLERMRQTIELQLKALQEGNDKKLEEMRKTVDEKLQGTLEKRLGESFQLVSERLEAVQRGLGEMQTLATGVGDLKRVLTNVKTRGTWGEVQLGAILEQVLTPEQFDRNVATKEGSQDRVEFAVRLPGADVGGCVWLPIDSKFPQEDYLRLIEASEQADANGVAEASAALARAARLAAREIHDKYVDPPHTTDFALMFLPTESLYAEVLRQPALVEDLQRRHIVVTGPTTLVATLNSLRVGFKTLALQQRASEVWRILAAVKTEFGRFGEVLEKVKRQLQSASRTIEDTGVRTRQMERKLREIEQLPAGESNQVLDLEAEAVQPEDLIEPVDEIEEGR